MKNLNLIIGQNIKKMLKINSLTQTELSNHLGVPRQTINKIVSGSRVVSCIELKSIANFFACSMEKIIEEQTDVVYSDNVFAFLMSDKRLGNMDDDISKINEITNIYLDQYHASLKG